MPEDIRFCIGNWPAIGGLIRFYDMGIELLYRFVQVDCKAFASLSFIRLKFCNYVIKNLLKI
ncbi:hypothetical protein DFO77_10385 [Marinilabilia salmonicolor]|jgi:hypothetical protein|uniref:Uncharacterized protein n=1 Tax=Marinilabilia salmonicolor TaxID=989 RepID=A0A368VED5_9BACT|nr:hypothetical protein DFO77_10385 [Marinilabilia salmonicolor]